MIDKALLARIRKCLALSASSNEHEAASALAKARVLMHEHGISDDQLRLADIEETTARASRNQRPPRWECYLDAAVCRALEVFSFINEVGDRTFIGRGAGPEIAGYAFAVLFRQLKAARSQYIRTSLKRCKAGRKRQRADVFCEGWAASIYGKIAAIAPEQSADRSIDQYLAEFHPGLVTVDNRAAKMTGGGVQNDWLRGRCAGRSIHLHSGLGAANDRLALS